MTWANHNERMRRYLRDPDGNIWTDAELQRLFNIEQINFLRDWGGIEDVTIVRMPPLFQFSYMHAWEWPYTEHEQGYVYSCISDRNYYDQASIAYMFRWEPEIIAGSDSTVSEIGHFYTHPWEAWFISGQVQNPPPCWVADRFHKTIFMAQDKEPLRPLSEKAIMNRDRSWRTRTGKSFYYWRSETLENFIHIYPLPATVTWSDPDGDTMVLYGLGATASSNRGTVTDYTGAYASVNDGIGIDLLEKENNLLVVYEKLPKDMDAADDVSDFPAYLTKYIEYGTLERAYSANNDGHIKSLEEYWAFRKQVAKRVLTLFKHKRLADRDFALKTQLTPPQRSQRHPRLPDAYPAVW